MLTPVAFSEEATERQRILAKRRDALVHQARRRLAIAPNI
jgi:hypothetical protein